MRDAISPTRLLSFEDFLEIEEASDVRHEFVGGVLYAMAGATQRHNIIATNIIYVLIPAARTNGCRVFPSNLLTRIRDDAGYYPDISVACDPGDTHERFIEQPCLVVEITSPSSVDCDQREKLLLYRGIQSLQTYLVVFQDQRRVIRHWRDTAGGWHKDEIAGDGSIEVPCPGTTLRLGDIYLGVAFDDA